MPLQERSNNGHFGLFIVAEVVIILFYGLFTTYDATADTTTGPQDNAMILEYYPMYQDVHVMIFIGFGFLMTFLRRYGYGAVTLTFFLSCVAIQWSILTSGFWHQAFAGAFHTIQLSVVNLINADFAAAAVMISFGGVIGRVRVEGCLHRNIYSRMGVCIKAVCFAVNQGKKNSG